MKLYLVRIYDVGNMSDPEVVSAFSSAELAAVEEKRLKSSHADADVVELVLDQPYEE